MDDERYDQLLYIAEKFAKSENLEDEVRKIFPRFNPEDTHNDARLNDYVIEQYAYARSLGMEPDQAAYSAEISFAFIEECLEGKGLSLKQFLRLIKAERFAAAKMRREQLAVLTSAAKEGDTKAAITLMEKVWPKLYAKQLVLKDDANPAEKWTDEELDSKIRVLVAEISNERRESNK